MVIKPLLIGVLESALNKYILLDQNSSLMLTPMAGKVIAINVQPFDETIYLCPSKASIQLLDQFPDQPDTILTGSISSLGLMGLSATPMRALFSGEVTIEGDIATGQKFQELFAKLDINLEPQLARFTGETIAHNISQFFRTGKEWSKESLNTFRLNTAEFLQEETRDLPAKPEMDIFCQHVDILRTDFDRLQSRIERLENLQNQ
ncbi:MAG: SCP2 sterol-binding domain-containing protein [Methylococcaceae bacterium]|jgi:ubiquinone biosynthesis protein UbiJ|nr:SCP2 sterol-binding domain-containing protein [Methylococcaceae bacterium]MDZ4156205.1 SCP2 sterol-binding domain-containing protein [Methylococcales bacterium]MDP2393783.1 SCP2 sterol-binding domain-containing protein [Methylococcaceae bacterium]MDP3019809.1 SCP2 sterol-binding domain-containing protein [Methylococcaceae bacterium]MDP3389586.1 SCP2 sterol-binding domain-containing protein [Methylococcaceae bacterium]